MLRYARPGGEEFAVPAREDEKAVRETKGKGKGRAVGPAEQDEEITPCQGSLALAIAVQRAMDTLCTGADTCGF